MLALAVLTLVVSTAAAPAEASPAATAPDAPAAAAPARAAPAPVVPTQALVDKLGQGDRLFLAGDYRNALFAYQDAVYMQPRYAPALVRLGRTYLAMRYPAQAISQAEAALAEEPGSADARKVLDDAKAAAAKLPQPPTAAAVPDPAPAPKAGPKVYKLSPEAAAPAPTPTPPAQAQSAAQHYRTALGLLQNREWAKAVTELSDAILADPKLGVAYSARGSAQFGLGKYREAAEDYRVAMQLDPRLGTPIYGLAECYRVLGDGKKAAEMYDRYARSTATDVRDDLRALAAKRAEELR